MIVKRWYTVEPYEREILVVVSDEKEKGYPKIEKYLKIIFADQVKGASAFFLNVFDMITSVSFFTLIHVNPDSGEDEIAHECVHASWKILSQAGVVIDEENNEAQAYLVGHLIRLVLKTIQCYERACQKRERQRDLDQSTPVVETGKTAQSVKKSGRSGPHA